MSALTSPQSLLHPAHRRLEAEAHEHDDSTHDQDDNDAKQAEGLHFAGTSKCLRMADSLALRVVGCGRYKFSRRAEILGTSGVFESGLLDGGEADGEPAGELGDPLRGRKGPLKRTIHGLGGCKG